MIEIKKVGERKREREREKEGERVRERERKERKDSASILIRCSDKIKFVVTVIIET